MYHHLVGRRDKRIDPIIYYYFEDGVPPDINNFVGVVASDRRIYMVDIDMLRDYTDYQIPLPLNDTKGVEQYPLDDKETIVIKNLAVRTNEPIGTLGGHFYTCSTDEMTYVQRNVILYTNIMANVASFDSKKMGKITKSTLAPETFDTAPGGTFPATESVLGWTIYLGNGTAYYCTAAAMANWKPSTFSYDWERFISTYVNNRVRKGTITNTDVMFTYSKNILPAPVEAWKLMPGYVDLKMPEVASTWIRGASQISLDDANAHGALMTSVVMYPIPTSATSMSSVMANMVASKFLKETSNVGYVRWLFTAYSVITFDTCILPNAADVFSGVDPGAGLAGLMATTALAAMSGPQIGMQYVAKQTQKSTVFNNIGYSNTEFMFSDAFSYMYWFVPRFPYYVVSKGDYGLCITTITDHGEPVLWISGINQRSDAMFPLANCITPEEYLVVDGFTFAKHKFFYDLYIKRASRFEPPSDDPGTFSEILIGAYPFKLDLPGAEHYTVEDVTLPNKDVLPMATLKTNTFNLDFKKSQFVKGLNTLNKTGLTPEQEWQHTPLDPYEVVFAKGSGTPETGLLLHHEPYDAGKPSVLLSISSEPDVLGSLIEKIVTDQKNYIISTSQKKEVAAPINNFRVTFYTLITLIDYNDQLKKMASSYQMIADIYGGVGYYIVDELPENNETRYTLWGGAIGSATTYRQMLFATDCLVVYDSYLRNFNNVASNDNIFVSSVKDMPFGTLNKTPMIIKMMITKQGADPTFEYVNIEIDTLTVTPLSITKVYDEIIPGGPVAISKVFRKGKYVLFHTHDNLIFFKPDADPENQVKKLSWPKPKNVPTLNFCHIGNFGELMANLTAKFDIEMGVEQTS